MTDYKPIIHRSNKARNLILKITSDAKIILTLPHGFPLEHAYAFMKHKNQWIVDKMASLKQTTSDINFKDGSSVKLMDAEHKIEIKYTNTATTKVFIDQKKILVFTNKHTNESTINKSVIKSLKYVFKKQLESTISKYNVNSQFCYKRLAIKDNRTNWGSCSAKGNLNFNWRLIFAPRGVFEYVVVHELCHLLEHNHSNKFWQLVEFYYPDYKIQRDWLKTNGHKLSI